MADTWFSERSFYQKMAQSYQITDILHREQSPYQLIEVFQTEAVGKLLTLDGKTMVSEKDEFVYHEVMAHIPYMIHPNVENVLIIGGGDGGVVREFVKHVDIKNIDLVEIDERVIEVSRKFFPQCTSGLDDPRVNILPQDGMKYLEEKKNSYDVIVIDSTDPVDLASELFTANFYKSVHEALKENGLMINQTENPFFDEYNIQAIYQNMKSNFKNVYSFYAPMVIYPGVFWTFGVATKGLVATELVADKVPAMNELEKSLQWYNTDWHTGAFKLSNFHKNKIGLSD